MKGLFSRHELHKLTFSETQTSSARFGVSQRVSHASTRGFFSRVRRCYYGCPGYFRSGGLARTPYFGVTRKRPLMAIFPVTPSCWMLAFILTGWEKKNLVGAANLSKTLREIYHVAQACFRYVSSSRTGRHQQLSPSPRCCDPQAHPLRGRSDDAEKVGFWDGGMGAPRISRTQGSEDCPISSMQRLAPHLRLLIRVVSPGSRIRCAPGRSRGEPGEVDTWVSRCCSHQEDGSVPPAPFPCRIHRVWCMA